MRNLKLTKLALSLAAAFAAGAASAAVTSIPLTLDEAQEVADRDQANQISVGGYYNQINGSAKSAAKTWNGAGKQKGGADVDVHYSGGTAEQGWSVDATDVGTPIPSVKAEYGKASSFDLSVSWQRLRHLKGEDVLIVPLGSDLSTDNLKETEIGQVRDVYDVKGRVFLTPSLVGTVDYTVQHRRGNTSLFDTSRTNGQSSGGVGQEVVYDVDDTHHQIDTALSFKGNGFTASLSYYLSKFDNDNDTPVVILPDGTFKHTFNADPSNTLHKLGFDTTFDLGERSTLSVAGSYSWNKLDSDNSFTDGTLSNTAYYDSNTETKIPTFDVSFYSNPVDPLTVNLKYSFRKTDTSTDWANEILTLETVNNSRYVDVDYTQHKFSGDAVYSFGHGYSLKAYGSWMRRSYDDDSIQKGSSYKTLDHTDTYKVGLQFRKRMSELISGTLGYEYSGRSADEWGTLSGSYAALNNPWNMAGYNQNQVKGTLVLTPTDRVTLTANGSVYSRDYTRHYEGDNNSVFAGLMEARGLTLGLDADFTLTRSLSVFAFYDMDYRKNEVGGDAWKTPRGSSTLTYYDRNFTAKDIEHTIGLGFDVHPEQARWRFSMQYVYGFAKTKWDMQQTGVSESVLDVPDDEWRTHYLLVKGSYELTRQWTLNGTAVWGRRSSDDYRQLGTYINDGDHYQSWADITSSPNYNAGAFYVGVTYKFD